MIYGDRTIVGFVGFDQQMAPWSAPEKSYFSSACEYVKLLRLSLKTINNQSSQKKIRFFGSRKVV
jgi:hypothetical protein